MSFSCVPLLKTRKKAQIWSYLNFNTSFYHEVGLIQRSYFELFCSKRSIFPPYKKSAPNESDFKVFRTYAVILAKYAISTWPNLFSAQNMDHNQLKTCSKYHLVGLSDEKQGPTFGHFLYLFNLTDPLNL